MSPSNTFFARMTLTARRSAAAVVRHIRVRWPELVVVIAVAWAFRPTLLGSAHFPYDAEFFHYPLLRTVQQLLASGTIPSWDAYTYGGSPLLANAQSAWLYPPQLLLDGVLAVLGRPLTEHTMDVFVVAHFAVAGLGTAAVARARGLGGAGAAYAGAFTVLTGETIAQSQHVLMIEMIAWLPWAMLAIDRMSSGVTARRVVALGVTVALMLTAGFVPQMPACVAVLLGTALARGYGRRAALAGLVLGLATGAAIAAAMWVPLLEILRVYPPLGDQAPLLTRTLVTALLPDAYGHWQASAAGYTGPGNFTLTYFYLGGTAVVLLPIAMTAGRQALREALLILALGLVTFGATAGHVSSVLQATPVFGSLWRPATLALVIPVPLGLLLARGLARPPNGRALALVGVVLLAAAAVPIYSDPHTVVHFLVDDPAPTLVALGLSLLLFVFAWATDRLSLAASNTGWRRLLLGPALPLGLIAVIGVAELSEVAVHRYFVNAPGAATSAGPNSSGDGSMVLSALRHNLAPGERIGADIDHLSPPWAGFPPIWHVSDVNGFQPQFSKYQLARVASTGADFLGQNRQFPIARRVIPYLQEMDAGLVVTSAADDPFRGVRVFADASYHVDLLPGRFARAHAAKAACVRRLGVDELVRCFTGPQIQTDIAGDSVRRLRIASNRGVPLLITGEPWYPGWSASTPRGNLVVRRIGYLAAVTVPRGIRQVTLSYNAPGLVLGALVSLLAVLVSIAVVARSGRPRGQPPTVA